MTCLHVFSSAQREFTFDYLHHSALHKIFMEVSLFHRWHSRAKTGTLDIFKVISMKCKLKKTYAVWYWCPAATDKSFLHQQKVIIPVLVLTGVQSLVAKVAVRSFCKSEECEQFERMTYTLKLHFTCWTINIWYLVSSNVTLQK